MDFKNWFCLKDRESFTIDPKINSADARFYFGRDQLDQRMKNQLKRAFIDPQVPKMMVWGPYGCGKTQTLYYLDHWMEHDTPTSCKGKPHTVHVEIEVRSKSTAAEWHLQNMEALGMAAVQDWLNIIYPKHRDDFDAELSKLTSDPNIVQAFRYLVGTDEKAFNAWRWLSGQSLTSKELQEIQVTRNLGSVGVGDLVAALQACGALAVAVGRRLVFFIDEMEELKNVRTGDAAESWHQYIRKLADNANSSVGFVIGFMAQTRDEAPEMLVRGDVSSRISPNNYIELDTLSAPANVKQFVQEMLAHLVYQEEAEKRIQAHTLPSTKDTYPFTATAFDLLCDYACQDVIKSTPRNIIRTINECAIAAWDGQKKVIDDEIVNEIAPIIFG
jgi:hypothetical protein